jgi:hypothetical protein
MLKLLRRQLARSETPFLHVMTPTPARARERMGSG